tara:strand:+ start:311 stop:898 length:588 start_codon:yes stop_codon:yes gene_type:complete
MSRDYKNLRNNKKSDPEIKNASNLFIFLIGLVLGVFITSTIFFNHFNKIYNGESTLAITDKDDIKKKNNNDKITNTEIIFDFPTILEERQVTEIPKKEYKEIIDANEDKSRTIYILQVGSFKNFKSADALEAKLAFLGLSAYIDKKNIIDKGIIYRVYVGPFEDKEKLNEIKIKLSENNVSSIVSIEQKIENKSM